MPTSQTLAVALAFATIAIGPALSQQPAPAAPPAAPAPAPMAYGAPINFENAKKAMAAAEAEAQRNNWPVAISLVDSGGNLVMFSKIDNTQHGSIRIAHGKARTALDLRRPTKALEDAVAGGGAALRLLAVPDLYPLEGGVLIVQDGKIAGAIGVSGVTSAQDAQVARAGADAVK